MITKDHLDNFLLFRRVLIHRKDVLNDSHTLYVLVVLRQTNKGNSVVSMGIELRKIRRATAKNIIRDSFKVLLSCGYVRQSSGKGSLYYITQEGLQALKDFNDSIECADYVNYNKKAPISKKVKRPGL